MKSTGIVRRLDDLGRLVIPKEMRRQYRLKEGDSIEFFTDGERIVIENGWINTSVHSVMYS